MDADLLELDPIPPAAVDADLPLCLTMVVYDDGPIVAAFWWDESSLHDLGARLADEHGALADRPLEEGELGDEGKPGWRWWRVGDETPWAYDPRIMVASVQAVGDLGTPADVAAMVRGELEDDPEPSWSREQSAEMVIRRLPFWGVNEEVEAAMQADPSIGTGNVVVELPEEEETR